MGGVVAAKARAAPVAATVAKGQLGADETLYRGINKFGADKTLAGDIGKGCVIEDPAFMSTSRSPGVAKQFQTAAKDNLLIRICAKAGTKALDVEKMSDLKGENEVPFPRNTKLRVVKWDRKNRVLDVEAIGD